MKRAREPEPCDAYLRLPPVRTLRCVRPADHRGRHRAMIEAKVFAQRGTWVAIPVAVEWVRP